MKKLLVCLVLSGAVQAGIEQEIIVGFRGDADNSGGLNISDAVFTSNYLFSGGPSPACYEFADSNSDGVVNVSDVLFTMNYLFDGGPQGMLFEVITCQ